MSIKLALAAFTAAALTAGIANANVIDQSAVHNFATLNQTGSLDFNGFDATLGTLTGVSFYFTSDSALQDLLWVYSSTPVSVGSPLLLTATATINTTSLFSSSASTTLTTPGFTGTVTGPVFASVVGTAASTLTSNTVTASNLVPFIGGTDSVSVDVSSIGSQGGTVPDTIASTGNSGSALVTGFLEYVYTPVAPPTDAPEPASLALLGASLFGLGLIRRRRV